ncbi:hypothetical protein OE88DRAFT_1662254 [Heliocybe sulcata]|uniref:Uncharacterized protein n=1 Tax=Heliocybe sulcata TaxID=5364 RepID=A0A5C3MVY7_9AGAM|nr:hypothetical protein OE88DRAFT_1662254 [Heliocybe sulcata]
MVFNKAFDRCAGMFNGLLPTSSYYQNRRMECSGRIWNGWRRQDWPRSVRMLAISASVIFTKTVLFWYHVCLLAGVTAQANARNPGELSLRREGDHCALV